MKNNLLIVSFVLLLQNCWADVATNNVESIKVRDFFKNIQWDRLQKSEFESQAEHTARVEKGFKFNGTPVWLEVSDSDTFFSYNAEDKKAVVGLEIDYGSATRPYNNSRFCLGSTNWSIGHRPEQNAFGAKADVTYYQGEKFEINVLNLKRLPKTIKPNISVINLGLIFKIDPADAQSATKSKTLALLVCVTIDHIGNAQKTIDAKAATIDSPVCSVNDVYEIPARLTALKVIDKSSGKTLASWSQN